MQHTLNTATVRKSTVEQALERHDLMARFLSQKNNPENLISILKNQFSFIPLIEKDKKIKHYFQLMEMIDHIIKVLTESRANADMLLRPLQEFRNFVCLSLHLKCANYEDFINELNEINIGVMCSKEHLKQLSDLLLSQDVSTAPQDVKFRILGAVYSEINILFAGNTAAKIQYEDSVAEIKQAYRKTFQAETDGHDDCDSITLSDTSEYIYLFIADTNVDYKLLAHVFSDLSDRAGHHNNKFRIPIMGMSLPDISKTIQRLRDIDLSRYARTSSTSMDTGPATSERAATSTQTILVNDGKKACRNPAYKKVPHEKPDGTNNNAANTSSASAQRQPAEDDTQLKNAVAKAYSLDANVKLYQIHEPYTHATLYAYWNLPKIGSENSSTAKPFVELMKAGTLAPRRLGTNGYKRTTTLSDNGDLVRTYKLKLCTEDLRPTGVPLAEKTVAGKPVKVFEFSELRTHKDKRFT